MKPKNLESYNSRADIKSAAIEEFSIKGLYGTRMEGIGRKAKINKAMVYYYFSSKEQLYREILEDSMSLIFTDLGNEVDKVITTVSDDKQALRRVIGAYFDVIAKHAKYLKMIYDSLVNEPDELLDIIRKVRASARYHRPNELVKFLQKGMENGRFIKSDPNQILLSLISLSHYFVVAIPAAKVMLGIDHKDEKVFLQQRRQSIIDLMMNGILKK